MLLRGVGWVEYVADCWQSVVALPCPLLLSTCFLKLQLTDSWLVNRFSLSWDCPTIVSARQSDRWRPCVSEFPVVEGPIPPLYLLSQREPATTSFALSLTTFKRERKSESGTVDKVFVLKCILNFFFFDDILICARIQSGTDPLWMQCIAQ